MHDNAYTDFCQNCVLGLQWNMKIKSKVKNNNDKKKATTTTTNKQTKNKKWLTIKDMNQETNPCRTGKKNTRSDK